MAKIYEIIRAILEVAPIGIYIVNSKGRIDYVNAIMLTISGDTYEDFKTMNVFELPTYKELGLDDKIKSVFDGNSFSMQAVKYTSHFSKKTTVRNIIGIPLEEEKEKKALIFIEDITQIKKAEDESMKAMAIKSQFISTVSHELRTPLAIIKWYLDTVQDETVGKLNEKQKELLTTAKENADRLTRLINNVLDYQKLEVGWTEFKTKEEDVNSLIENAAKNMRPLAVNKKLELKLSLSKDLPEIKIDKDKITQVLTNLINNALKFTDNGTITVTSKKEGNTISIAVSDTGFGIKKEDMDKLFHTFSQIPVSEEGTRGGTGLGLAISKRIVQEHRGKIDVQSEHGKGSTFKIYLPIT